ncbi:PPM-type phosphatase domain-containing protein [Mycena indigotica]|uniref:PPM-type phosphatase domain-containing protein n=1 Tax=Mycena indigotica TaxID=2126181 RepID=A0A8H6WJW7_9AGAR|nr:PPM-type phosphatase domain-containing protein [Mycena indigotica]KAF7314979.1 PPM-type phosphatase domain-containing protein [Mycena indigotica]
MATRFTRIWGQLPRSRYAFGGASASAIYLFQSSRKSDDNGRVEQTSVGTHPGIARVDSASVPSNFPCEDRMSSLTIPSSAWSFWAIYDGHSGHQTSALLEQRLIPTLVEKLQDLYRQTTKAPEKEPIHQVFKNACLELDDEIVNKTVETIASLPETAPRMTLAATLLQAARSGSCALVAFYEANLRRLHVALVGDSRAILGRPRQLSDGKTIYDLHILSVDHNAKNPAEIARLEAAHPNEPELLNRETGRLLGWGCSRAFGDGVMKWTRDIQTWMEKDLLGSKPRATLLTPPYFTAEPEVTTIDIQPGDFMIMASDGLWDNLTSEDAVGLVGAWIDRWGIEALRSFDMGSVAGHRLERSELPVKITDKQDKYPWWNAQKRFINADSFNAASHLVRNALGGANTDLHDALLATPAPRSRYQRRVLFLLGRRCLTLFQR